MSYESFNRISTKFPAWEKSTRDIVNHLSQVPVGSYFDVQFLTDRLKLLTAASTQIVSELESDGIIREQLMAICPNGCPADGLSESNRGWLKCDDCETTFEKSDAKLVRMFKLLQQPRRLPLSPNEGLQGVGFKGTLTERSNGRATPITLFERYGVLCTTDLETGPAIGDTLTIDDCSYPRTLLVKSYRLVSAFNGSPERIEMITSENVERQTTNIFQNAPFSNANVGSTDSSSKSYSVAQGPNSQVNVGEKPRSGVGWTSFGKVAAWIGSLGALAAGLSKLHPAALTVFNWVKSFL